MYEVSGVAGDYEGPGGGAVSEVQAGEGGGGPGEGEAVTLDPGTSQGGEDLSAQQP